ncbi:hypothetical protein IKF94_03745 [Candidatus Saccharibacteria bacterium]|nr:hypothetical protein [Candidatus Saccharibacteria bacterium]
MKKIRNIVAVMSFLPHMGDEARDYGFRDEFGEHDDDDLDDFDDDYDKPSYKSQADLDFEAMLRRTKREEAEIVAFFALFCGLVVGSLVFLASAALIKSSQSS